MECSLPSTIKINYIEIDKLYYTKFLGVIIDHKLNWKEHINLICKKVSRTIAVVVELPQAPEDDPQKR